MTALGWAVAAVITFAALSMPEGDHGAIGANTLVLVMAGNTVATIVGAAIYLGWRTTVATALLAYGLAMAQKQEMLDIIRKSA
ncbi:hypothetical protein C1I98_24655 [Spongiactinospora gelatinilytica]|uniref:Uncharacterized protein n=1 Tax=Spongiactinospora gelatinilytica TaxID=2666298 RepID=A0A2W2FQS5_9ACTN|nr:hypothetical protein C1I98_24655 [Spongiactinospora gelatinilytica]